MIEHREAYKDRFEDEVEGLIQICKDLAQLPQDHRDALFFMAFDPRVVREAKNRVDKSHTNSE